MLALLMARRRWVGWVLFATLVAVGFGIAYRHAILVALLAGDGPPPLLDPTEEGPHVRWFDDYFVVQELDARTFALGEPRYHQQNWSYLLVGDERAVLFDAGPGVRDIRPVVASLTEKPVTFVPSHFHFDHTGNEVTFEHVAVVDLPYLRERAPDGALALAPDEHLGSVEGFAAPTLEVDEWLAPGAELDLGGRVLEVLYTPGHTEDSISLLDRASGQLFSGDFLYPGPLFAFLGGSSLDDYLFAAETVLNESPSEARVFGAHRLAPPGAPEQSRTDVADLKRALLGVQAGTLDGTGVYPVEYPVNESTTLLAEPSWLQNWRPGRGRTGAPHD